MRIFGRKKGRKLSSAKQKLVENFLPNISLHDEKNLNHLLSLKKPLCLEIGFGHGENLIKMSLKKPNWFFIAIDPFLNGVASLLEKIKKNKIQNIFIFHGDCRVFLKDLPIDSISKVCILFPDPWSKKKHEPRRIIQNDFLKLLSKIMKENSLVHISSDDWTAQTWILKNFLNSKNFIWVIDNIHETYEKPEYFENTKYYKKSLAQGRQASWLKFKNIKFY